MGKNGNGKSLNGGNGNKAINNSRPILTKSEIELKKSIRRRSRKKGRGD